MRERLHDGTRVAADALLSSIPAGSCAPKRPSGEPVLSTVDAPSLLELQQLVEAALARHGMAGDVRVNERFITLEGHGPTASAEVSHVISKWGSLSLAERQHECNLLARSLTKSRRSAVQVAPRRRRPSLLWLAAPVLLAGVLVAYRLLSFPSGESAAASEARRAPREIADPDHERDARAARVCNAARTRLARGATLGPTDAEGWVVELSLVRNAEGPAWTSLEGFVSGDRPEHGRLAWTGAPELMGLSGPNTRVEVQYRELPEGGAPEFRELTLVLHGEYVLPYFREAERIKLIRFAHALGAKQQAWLGALYGRCAGGTAHHLGSWFLGTSPGAAATALLYYMAAHAQPPLLSHDLLSTRAEVPFEPAFALGTLLARTGHLQKQDVASGIGAQDGMVAGPPHFTTLGFPFVDSDRALRASYALSRLLPAAQARR